MTELFINILDKLDPIISRYIIIIYYYTFTHSYFDIIYLEKLYVK